MQIEWCSYVSHTCSRCGVDYRALPLSRGREQCVVLWLEEQRRPSPLLWMWQRQESCWPRWVIAVIYLVHGYTQYTDMTLHYMVHLLLSVPHYNDVDNAGWKWWSDSVHSSAAAEDWQTGRNKRVEHFTVKFCSVIIQWIPIHNIIILSINVWQNQLRSLDL